MKPLPPPGPIELISDDDSFEELYDEPVVFQEYEDLAGDYMVNTFRY